MKEGFEYLARYLNLRHMRAAGSAAPPEFEGRVDAALLKKTREYETENTRFSFVSSLFGNLLTILFFFGGLLNIFNSWIASLNLSFVFSGWLFFMLLFYADDFLSIPFGLYHTFKIENKYGFNTMTPGLWISDFIKSILISTILMSLMILAGLWLVRWSPEHWWFWVWAFLFVFSIFMMYLSPYVIEPLFNKFTPIEDESLREGITALAEKAGIHVSRVLRIDASKRSKHSNAYFTGIGRTKRIVLYDTLLEGMDRNEIIAVLAHEIGHWKKKHLLKMLAALEIFSLATLYLAFRLIRSDFLLEVFHIGASTLFAKVILLAFLAGIVSLPLKPVMNFFSRRHERQADRASYELTHDPESMVHALVKLSKENLSNLHPHPLYVAMYYSHPPVLERIGFLRGLGKQHRGGAGEG